MFLPPEPRRPANPPRPPDGLNRRGEAVLIGLVLVFLLSALLAPIGGSTLVEVIPAVLHVWKAALVVAQEVANCFHPGESGSSVIFIDGSRIVTQGLARNFACMVKGYSYATKPKTNYAHIEPPG